MCPSQRKQGVENWRALGVDRSLKRLSFPFLFCFGWVPSTLPLLRKEASRPLVYERVNSTENSISLCPSASVRPKRWKKQGQGRTVLGGTDDAKSKAEVLRPDLGDSHLCCGIRCPVSSQQTQPGVWKQMNTVTNLRDRPCDHQHRHSLSNVGQL